MLKYPLQADSIKKSYGKKLAIDLSIFVQRNEVLGLVGVNGSGKTTTLNILAGVLQPDKGSVYVQNKEGIAYDIELKKNLSYLPEEREEIDDLTVREYLTFISQAYGKNKAGIIPALEQVNASDVLNKQFSSLSKGYQQRILFAGILIADTPIIILDEMTDGLDPLQRKELYSVINSIKTDKSIILASHNLQEIKEVCDRVCIIKDGSITNSLEKDQFEQIEQLLK